MTDSGDDITSQRVEIQWKDVGCDGRERELVVASLSVCLYRAAPRLLSPKMEEQMWKHFYDKLQEKENQTDEDKSDHDIR